MFDFIEDEKLIVLYSNGKYYIVDPLNEEKELKSLTI
jgi:hypothetical protein